MKNEERDDLLSRYEIDIVPNEHGGYHARVPDFPTIFTGGDTPSEAMKNALEAIDLMVDEYEDRDLPVPLPLDRFSGQFNVRIPKAVHRELVRSAEIQGVSLNAMVGLILAQATGLVVSTGTRRRGRKGAQASASPSS